MQKSFLFILIFSLLQVSISYAGKTRTQSAAQRARSRDSTAGSAAGSNYRGSIPESSVEPISERELRNAPVNDPSLNETLTNLPEVRIQQQQPAFQNSAPGTNQNISAIGESCRQETETATNTCNFGGSKEAQLAVGMANQMRQQLNAATMSSPAAMCSKMSAATQAIDAAVTAFSGYCTTAYSSCDSACTADIEELNALAANPAAKEAAEERKSEVQKIYRNCKKLAGNVKNVFENVGGYVAIEQAKSQYCGEQTNALAELCKSQPTNALCKTAGNANCADPNTAASNLVCICQANSRDPRCGAQSQMGSQAGVNPNGAAASGGGTADGASALGDFGGMGGDGIGGAGFNGNAMNDGGGGGSPKAGFGSGRGGGGLGGGGGSNASAGKGGPGGGAAGRDPINAKIISGYGVGGVAGNGVRYGGGAAGGPGGVVGRNGYMAANGRPGVDLRKFLPGGQMDPSRGLAGVSGPDGITGPNTDIWKKIQMRYFSVSPSLLP